MQDIKLLQPQQVIVGRENKDLCIRLHEEMKGRIKNMAAGLSPS